MAKMNMYGIMKIATEDMITLLDHYDTYLSIID